MAQLDNTFGMLYISAAVGAIFFGLSIVQAFLYFQTHRDSGVTFYKLAVYWLLFLDALHVVFVNSTIYYYLVTNYANPPALLEIAWSFKAQMVIDTFIVSSVHLLYLPPIWIICKGRNMRILPVFMTASLVPISAVATVLLLVEMFKCYYLSDLKKILWCLYMSLGCATLVAFMIASSMCYLLVTSNTKTDMTLRSIVRAIINTGCLTSICSMACIITLAAMPDNFVYLGFEFLLSKLYVNSYLALLNARYYHDINAHTSQRRPPRVYRPELQVNVSQDGFPRTSGADKFQVSDRTREHTYYPPAADHPIAVVVETESFSM
ncbi:hypothetical protein DFH29DRAFT_33669 [Suillus ampliporus]|nr:hypothetical protein DFH29DRAFT_33669 [Suillus ampliporus]